MDAFLNIFCIWIGCMISIILTLGLMEGLGRPATRTSPNGVTTTRYSPLHLILFVFLFLFAFIELKFRFQDPLGLHPVRALPPVRLMVLPSQLMFWFLRLVRIVWPVLAILFALLLPWRLATKKKVSLFFLGSATLAIAFAAFSYSYRAFLLVSVPLLVLLFVLFLRQLIRKRQAKEGNLGSSLILLGVFALFAFCLAISIPSYNQVQQRSYEITNITNVYNKDGSIRYDEDGNEVLHRDVEANDYQGTGFNILPLFCALGCYGCVFAGLFVTRAASRRSHTALPPM